MITSPFIAPWHDWPKAPEPVQVLWDYENKVIVGEGMCSVFDTSWIYCYDGVTVTGWWVVKYPGADRQYLMEHEVPDEVRLAVMVCA